MSILLVEYTPGVVNAVFPVVKTKRAAVCPFRLGAATHEQEEKSQKLNLIINFIIHVQRRVIWQKKLTDWCNVAAAEEHARSGPCGCPVSRHTHHPL